MDSSTKPWFGVQGTKPQSKTTALVTMEYEVFVVAAVVIFWVGFGAGVPEIPLQLLQQKLENLTKA